MTLHPCHTLRDQLLSDREYQAYWHDRAMDKAAQLAEVIGYVNYCDWVDELPWKGGWRELHDLIVNRLAETECTCDLDMRRESMACPACRATIEKEVIPF